MQCPRCKAEMRPVQQQTPSGRIEVDYCPQCRGIFFDHGELEELLQLDGSSAFSGRGALFVQPTAAPGESARTGPPLFCPRHRHLAMTELVMTGAGGSFMSVAGADKKSELRIDRCAHCSGIWLDGGELAALTDALDSPQAHPLLAHKALSGADIRAASPWLWLFMFLTALPVETWQTRARRPPVVIVLLILCCAIFGLEFFYNGEQLVETYALVPARLWHGDWLPLFTHMFLHGSIPHLLGNMYCLWIFGDNVEDRLGSGYFVLLYLISGLAAALLQCLLTTEPTLPIVGASGAIAGVMGAYMLLFPKARLVSLIFVFPVRWKTSTYLLLWMAVQVIGVLLGKGQVAWWAHIGGFLVGAALVWNRRPLAAPRQDPVVATWPPVNVQKLPAQSSEPPPLFWK